ncbi:MAG TPA: cell division protein BolA [Chromatiaceae bacterium]|jgi:hypothetical protein|nr:MAG: hypothetical protein N838_11605 [Thiohalocapsa sp. PB-PSB1]QQO53280.1 MAG: cell division protein BolA [Thiohalocapsa sp. PB-PSB1]HBG94177.1 cell division protein BolA [Chromatiaceae bacterium]HCS91453.1 cell division protein BolA [Chromatiaceae bacterium]
MNVCQEIKTFSKNYEVIADLFSLLAVVLLFVSVWATLEFYQPTMHWLSGNYVLRVPLLMVGLGLNAFSILALLAVGSARYTDDDEPCFGTFPGRRTRHGAKGVFVSWVDHMENVGKKHR